MYRIEYTRIASKQLLKLPAHIARKIRKEMEEVAANPRRAANVKKLVGEDKLYRLRVGDYRVVFQIEHGQLLILVVKVAHRKEVYQ